MRKDLDLYNPASAIILSFHLNTTTTYYIIDDDLDDQQFLIEALTENDATVQCTTATNGQAAIDYLKKVDGHLPDAIFLDLNMPCMSGNQCLLELKSLPILKNIPVIIYSTSFNSQEKENCMKMGAFYFLVKSFSFQSLKEELTIINAALLKNS
jgi:CheY-like chemotaxis protein